MSLQKIILENVQSFRGRHEIDIPKGLVIITGENQDDEAADINRIGKTTLTNCLPLCMYGRTGLVSRSKDFINIMEKSAYIQLLFDEFSVARYFNDAKFKNALIYNDKEITQEQLVREIEIDFNPFISTTFFGTSYSDLLDKILKSPVDAKKVLTDLMPKLSRFDEAYKKVNSFLDELTEIRVSLDRELAAKQGELEGLAVQFEDKESYQDKAFTFEKDRRMNLAKWKAQKEILEKELKPKMDEKAILNQEWDQLTKKFHIADNDLQDIKTEYARAEEEIKNLDSKMSGLRDELKVVQNKRCGRCGQKLPKPEEMIKQIKSEYLELEGKRNSIRIDPMKTRIKEVEEIISVLTQEDNKYSAKEKRLSDTIIQLQTQISDLNSKIQAEMNLENPFKGIEENNKQRIESLKTQIQSIGNKILKSQELRPYYEFLNKAFGSRGIKNFVFDEILYNLTGLAQPYLDFLTNNSIDIKFNPRKEKQRGGFTETMSLDISDRFGQRDNFFTWSTSERKKIALAVDLGMNRILVDMFQSPFDFLIFDETFDGLDQVGRNLFYDLIVYELRRLSTIFVTTHESYPSNIPHSLIYVTKKDGASKAEVRVGGI